MRCIFFGSPCALSRIHAARIYPLAVLSFFSHLVFMHILLSCKHATDVHYGFGVAVQCNRSDGQAGPLCIIHYVQGENDGYSCGCHTYIILLLDFCAGGPRGIFDSSEHDSAKIGYLCSIWRIDNGMGKMRVEERRMDND